MGGWKVRGIQELYQTVPNIIYQGSLLLAIMRLRVGVVVCF